MKSARHTFRGKLAAAVFVATLLASGVVWAKGSEPLLAFMPLGTSSFHFSPITWAAVATSTQARSKPQAAGIAKTAPTAVPGAVVGASVSATEAVTRAELSAALDQLGSTLRSQFFSITASGSSFSGPPATTLVNFQSFAASQRIDQLTGTSLINVTVSGVSGLTDADIPDGITAANYLPLIGGTLTGNLTLSGILTAGSLAVSAISSSGAIQAPYFTATSPAASSTFPNLLSTNSTTTNATSTNQYATALVAGNATSTNLFSTLGRFTTGIFDTLLTAASATITNLTATTLSATNATTARLDALDYVAVGGSATTTIRGDGVASTIPYASSTALTVSGTASTSNLIASTGFTFKAVTGFLKATAGIVSEALVDLAANVTGILPVANGGTGWAAIQTGTIPYGNGSSAFATSSTLTFDGTKLVATYASTTALTSSGSAYFATSAGNVGIGTTSPFARLSVGGNTTYFSVDTTLNAAVMNFGGSANTEVNILRSNTAGQGGINFLTNNVSNGLVGNTPANSFGLWGTKGVTLSAGSSGGSFYIASSTSAATYLIIPRNGGGTGAEYGFVSNVVDDGTAYPNQSAHFTFNTLGTTANTNAVLVIDRGSSNSNTRPSAMFANSVGIGSTSTAPTYKLDVTGNGHFTSLVDATNFVATSTSATSTFAGGITGPNNFVVQQTSGNVGIGTTTPWRKLSVTGTVGFDGLTGATGAGSLCLDANKQVVYNSGSDSCLSSTRITKHDITDLALSGINTVAALRSVSFIYNNDASSTVRYGFIAEDTAAVDPHFVTYDAQGNVSGVDDRSLISVLVKAVQELIAKVVALADTVAGFAESFTTKRLCVEKSDGTPVCVDGDQLASVLSGTPSPQGSDPTSPTTDDTTAPPSINIGGENPATIHVGDTYADLGATATDNQGHDLSYRTFINGVLSGDILIDTSHEATDTIDYVATDTWGNTATSTRTVIVEAAAAMAAAPDTDMTASTSTATSSPSGP